MACFDLHFEYIWCKAINRVCIDELSLKLLSLCIYKLRDQTAFEPIIYTS